MRKKKDTYAEPTYSKIYGSGKQRSKSQHSILQKHHERLEEFKNKQQRVKAVQDKINNCNKQLATLQIQKQTADALELSDVNHKINKFKNDIADLNSKKKLIESGNDETEYLLESSDIVLKYMSLEEQEYLLLEQSDLTDESSKRLNDITFQKNELIDAYFLKFEENYTGSTHKFTLENLHCKECNVPYDIQSSYLVCPRCGICVPTVEQAAELSYKEMQDYDYRPQFTYEKMTHLEDWLRRFQAKENKIIPQEILDKVILEAKKERIKDLNLLTEDKVKRYLKKLHLNEYYDNIIGIINRINGRPPFRLTPEIEDKIKTMFQQIQEPFEKFKPQGRKNFLSYSYVLHKMFQIIGLHEFAKYFPLLKSPDKLRQQDEIFSKIVGYVSQIDKTTNWVFYPSL
jgi:rubrerythrin